MGMGARRQDAVDAATAGNVVRDYQGNEYDPQTLRRLAEQIAPRIDFSKSSGGVFTLDANEGTNIGFGYNEAKKIIGANPTAADMVVLDMARHLAREGVTDISQLKMGTERRRGSDAEIGDYDYDAYGLQGQSGLFGGGGKDFIRFGTTYTGEGGTGYDIRFDSQGNPIFTTEGFDTSDRQKIAMALAMATLPFGGPAALGQALSGGALTGMGATALGGAALGGASSAIQGGNILKGALTGGITSVIPGVADQLIGSVGSLPINAADPAAAAAAAGGASVAPSGIAGALAQQGLSPTVSQALASGTGRALQGAATAALTGKDVGASALRGAVMGGATPFAAPAVTELTKAGVPIDLAKAGVVGTIGGLGSLATGKGFEAGALPAGVSSLVGSASKQVGFDKIPAPFRAVAEQGITSGLLGRPFNTEQALQNATLNYALSNTVGPQGISALNMANTMYQASRPRPTLTPTQMSAIRKFQAWKASRP